MENQQKNTITRVVNAVNKSHQTIESRLDRLEYLVRELLERDNQTKTQTKTQTTRRKPPAKKVANQD